MSTATTVNPTKVTIGPVRFSYLHVFEPQTDDKGDKNYSVSLIIPKSDKSNLIKLKKAIDAAKELGKEKKFGGKIPSTLKGGLRDGDEDREDEAYANSYFINAKSKMRPGKVDRNMNKIIDPEELKSGDYGYASINFFPYNHPTGGKGIGCGLNNLMKTKDGEALGGGCASAESDFADLEVEDDDLL